MNPEIQEIIKRVYLAFNARDTDTVLQYFTPDVHWPNGWEGGYVNGHEEVREYWARQWKEVDPNVEPVNINERADGKIDVDVHQVAKDLEGKLLFDGMLKHIYTFNNGLITMMEIEKTVIV